MARKIIQEFSHNFLGPMYALLRNSIVPFVTGLLAVKMTAKHCKHNVIGICVPNRDGLHKQGHSTVGYG